MAKQAWTCAWFAIAALTFCYIGVTQNSVLLGILGGVFLHSLVIELIELRFAERHAKRQRG